MVLNELTGTKYPIIQGGMANIATGAFAAAVSNAGALGLVASGGMNAQALREQIRECKRLTDKPFGVNLMLLNPDVDNIAAMLVEEKVGFITTGAGNPAKYMAAWKSIGAKVFPVVASVALAKIAERSGADAVIAEGGESGGHVGDMTTMTLVPQVADAVKIPVVAAGGIADGRGIAAAFMLGAEGVQCGTCFIPCDETNIHQNYKDLVIKASDIDTKVTGRSTGHPVRTIRNQLTKLYLKMEGEGATLDELEQLSLGSLRKAVLDGDKDMGSFMAGQISGLLKEQVTVKERIVSMMDQAETLLGGKK